MFSIKLKNSKFRFFYKLILFILIGGIILADLIESSVNISTIKNTDGYLIWALFDSDGEVIGFDHVGHLINWISFFTIQSNILVAVWLGIAVFCHSKEGKISLTKRTPTIAVAIYITVTFLIYNFLLLPTMDDYNLGVFGWFRSVTMHMVGPVLFVLYILLMYKNEELIENKIFMKKLSWKFLMYPIGYLIIIMIRGGLMLASGAEASLGLNSDGIIVPYFFLEIWKLDSLAGIPGAVWFLIAACSIAGICIGFGYLYNLIMNKTIKTEIE